MPARNPRLPRYPRPVSPISADEIPICEDTAVYRDLTDEAAESSEQRAARRRRIESHSAAYLRGRPLFILTAQLRGPFDSGWKDPWARNTTTNTKETVTSQQRSLPATKLAQGKKQDFTISKAESNRIPTRGNERREESISAPPKKKDESLPGDSKVRDWLRRNTKYQRSGNSQHYLTPPSPSEGKATERAAPRPNIDPTASVDDVVSVADQRDLPSGTLRHSQEFQTCLSSPLNSPIPEAAPLARSCFTSPPRQEDQDGHIYFKHRHRAAKQSRTEYATTRSRRGAERHTSPVGNRLSRYPGPKDSCERATASGESLSGLGLQPLAKKNLNRSEPAKHVTPGLNDGSDIVPNARDRPPPLCLTEETTKSSMTAELPSAQVPPLPVLASLPSNISSHRDMLRDAVNHCNDEAIDAGNRKRAAVVDVLIAEIDPASVVWSTNEAGSGKRKAASPVGNRAKRRLIPVTEHLAPDSTRGSIKSILKVAKPSVTIQDKITVSKTALLHGEDQQPDGDDGHRPAVTGPEPPKLSPASAPRSILKSSAQSLTKVLPNPGSSSDKQDAQRQQLLKIVDADDDFDVERAMDELGSYLGTWDVERKLTYVDL
ncbi:hypothetical protein AYL99_01890 [Fonsecaea erecta]|uniref:Uncharacterized protein n=1 Tax=Fonsecaea erecta TaxID=1367422 RepID=A0A178ZTY6_9EURO|nr:hypothetical protein AYL99_01890 [Fonsecaea erecta]OAP62663.1 hypothetical protein AYL99_01890 [Fonsecaea erecta]